MKVRSFLAIVSALLIAGVFLAACTPPASSEPCMFAANEALTVYRLPDVLDGDLTPFIEELGQQEQERRLEAILD